MINKNREVTSNKMLLRYLETKMTCCLNHWVVDIEQSWTWDEAVVGRRPSWRA